MDVAIIAHVVAGNRVDEKMFFEIKSIIKQKNSRKVSKRYIAKFMCTYRKERYREINF